VGVPDLEIRTFNTQLNLSKTARGLISKEKQDASVTEIQKKLETANKGELGVQYSLRSP